MPQPTEHLAQIYVEVEGTLLQQKYIDNLISVEIDDSLYLPDMFAINLLDPGLELLHNDVFKPGKNVKISIQCEGSQEKVQLMIGEITAIEPDLNSVDRCTFTARGYDRSHKLNRIRKTATFLNMTDSDIASKLAQGAGLQAKVTSTPVVYPYLMQANQTDWEFLMERAQRIGYRLFVEDRTLHFEPPPVAPPVETKVEWGIDLDQFRARLTTVEQVTEVLVRGWDPKAKREIVGRATTPSAALQFRKDEGRTGGQSAQSAHSVAGKQMVVDRPVYTQREADKLAQSMLDRSTAGFIQAEGVAGGNPNIRAGNSVNVDGVGPRFGGKYLITRALHRYTHKGYSSQFWVSGGNGTMTITDLLLGGTGNGSSFSGSKGADRPTARGVMVGLVTANNDPENLGRVKVKIPALGENVESYWCRLASTMAGPVRGIAYLPEVNDEVVVAFEHGDPNHGYVLGAVWNGNDKLPKPLSRLVAGGKTIRRVIKSRVGHEIMIDDTPDPGGLVLVDKTEQNLIQINTKDNLIKLECIGDIEIKSKTGKVSISGLKGVDVDGSPGQVNVKGTKVNFN